MRVDLLPLKRSPDAPILLAATDSIASPSQEGSPEGYLGSRWVPSAPTSLVAPPATAACIPKLPMLGSSEAHRAVETGLHQPLLGTAVPETSLAQGIFLVLPATEKLIVSK